MSHALIGLGSNLGDRTQTLDDALASINAHAAIQVVSSSRYCETNPVGGPAGQGEFLNGAAVLKTAQRPAELLASLQKVEKEFGRQRGLRWDARTLDLDILLYEKKKISTSDLMIPHRRMTFRRFVLEPAAEIAGDWCMPNSTWTIDALLANIDRRPLTVGIAGGAADQRVVLAGKLAACRDGLEAVSIEQLDPAPADPPSLLILLDTGASPFTDPPSVLRFDTNNWPNVEDEAVAAALAM